MEGATRKEQQAGRRDKEEGARMKDFSGNDKIENEVKEKKQKKKIE